MNQTEAKQIAEKIGIQWVLQLEFESPELLHTIQEKVKELYAKGKISTRELWLGSYYSQELQNAHFPDVRISWINSQVGWGVFAGRNLKKGEWIGEYCGLVRKRHKKDRLNAYCFEYRLSQETITKYLIDAEHQGNLSRFINHSSDPNLITDLVFCNGLPHVILTVKKPIAKDEQLLYDYGSDYWSYQGLPLNLK